MPFENRPVPASAFIDKSPDHKALIDLMDVFIDKHGWDALGELQGDLQTIRRGAGKDKEFGD